MGAMTAPQPRRTRRRSVPAASLPRPVSSDGLVVHDSEVPAASANAAGAARRGPVGRQHHVTNDYRYVRTDLVLVASVGAIVVAFVVAMSFLV